MHTYGNGIKKYNISELDFAPINFFAKCLDVYKGKDKLFGIGNKSWPVEEIIDYLKKESIIEN